MENKQVESVNNTSAEVSSDNVNITLNDLLLVRNIINVASRRGAFSAEEFSTIGTVYNKVDGFLKVHLKKMQDEETGENVDSNTTESENKIEI